MRTQDITAIMLMRRQLSNGMETLARIEHQEEAGGALPKITHSLNMAHDYIGEGAKMLDCILKIFKEEVMELKKKQAIENHRKMWNWIADETERLKRKIVKGDYFDAFHIKDIPDFYCYCCQYDSEHNEDCKNCPIEWEGSIKVCMCLDKEVTSDDQGLFERWRQADTWQEAARLAREIANRPERK